MTAPDPRALPDPSDLVVSVLGGTGEQGRGLARRLALAGVRVVLGSRDAARAQAAADDLPGEVSGADNAGAARAGDVVIVAVPWDGHRELLVALADDLRGKVVVDCVNPLGSASTSRAPTRCPSRRAAPPSRRSRCCRTAGWSRRSTT
jgi:NADPH-dependent F420 reductase